MIDINAPTIPAAAPVHLAVPTQTPWRVAGSCRVTSKTQFLHAGTGQSPA
jgi:hypothetical protein